MNYDKAGRLSPARRLAAMFAIYEGLPAPIYILFIANAINGIGIFVFPFLTLFLTKNFGMSEAAAGVFILGIAERRRAGQAGSPEAIFQRGEGGE